MRDLAENYNTESINFDLSDTLLDETEKIAFSRFLQSHRSFFATKVRELGKTKVTPHVIDPGSLAFLLTLYYATTSTIWSVSHKSKLYEVMNIYYLSNTIIMC